MEQRKVVQTVAHVGVLLTERRAAEGERPLQQRLGRIEPSEIEIHFAHDVEQPGLHDGLSARKRQGRRDLLIWIDASARNCVYVGFALVRDPL